MADDSSKDSSSGGFDDWLDAEPGPDSDVYAALSSDDGAEEISDWMAYTQGEASPVEVDAADESESEAAKNGDGASEDDEPSTVDEHAETEEMDTIVVSDDGESEDLDEDTDSDAGATETADQDDLTSETAVDESEADEPFSEDEAQEVSATSVDFEDFDGGGHPDTEEISIVADGLVVATDSAPSEIDDAPADADADDTGEMDALVDVGDVSFLAAETTAATEVSDPLPELFDVSQDDYLQTATREHVDLAAAIAEAEDEDTAQVALVAPIPGLEPTVVGFDDVVEAEGHRKVRARRSGDLTARITTAVVLIVALGASLVWRPALIAFAIAVFVLGAGEFYTALSRSGRKPIAIFGFVGIVAAGLGAFFTGPIAIPVAFVLVTAALLLFYAVVPGRPDPVSNLALTITVMVWVGLGTFAMLIAVSDQYRPLIIGVVVTVAAMDVAQYFVGRAIGRHQLSPWVSPKKTVEGLVGGVIVALAVGAMLHFVSPFELTSGLAIGVAVAILAPIGDLAMSAAKRSLGLKDMGSVLPGHGGFLDRIDGLLFVIPAAWAIFVWAGLL